jgi:hypothetical protein
MDPSVFNHSPPGGRNIFRARFEVLSECLLRSIYDDRPVWTQNSVIMQNERNKTASVLGLGYNSDSISDLAIFLGWKIENVFGFLLDTQKSTS